MSQWISVEDRLPGYSKRVLLTYKHYGEGKISRRVTLGYRSHTNGSGEHYTVLRGDHDVSATHWMPLPEPPK